MSAKQQKKNTSSKCESRAKSLLLFQSREAQKQISSLVYKKDKQKSRCFSIKEGAKSFVASTKPTKIESAKKKKVNANKKPIIVISQCETPMLGKFSSENANQKHFTTVGDLNSQQNEACSNVKAGEEEIGANLCSLAKQTIEESTIKPPFSIKANQKKTIFQIVPPKQLQQNLNTTIDKLKSKQLTIEMLNKTIDTRLADSKEQRQRKGTAKSREDVYEVEMNFYVDKISQLQKELHQKGKALKSAAIKSEESDMLARNCKKLLKDNLRLKEELQLSLREVAALKKLILRRQDSRA